MKRIFLHSLLLLFCLLAIPAEAVSRESRDSFTFGIQANRTAIEVFGEAGFHIQPSTVYVGGNGLYYEDKYRMASIHTMVGNVIHRGMTGKIGFKGVAGRFERKGRDKQDLRALAFSISGSYDLSEVIATRYVPVILHATFSYSPKPLSFNDTERFFEGLLAADWMFLENAAITASFRYLDLNFDTWDRSHGSGYFGFKFIF